MTNKTILELARENDELRKRAFNAERMASRRAVELEHMRKLLRFSRDPSDDEAALLDAVIAEVTAETGVSRDGIMSRRRGAGLVRARWIAFRKLRDKGLTLPQIGRLFDCDHTTVLYGLRSLAE